MDITNTTNLKDMESELNDDTAWLEQITIGGFRVWHIIVFCFGTLLSIIIMFCCCMKFRIPRTKQEIEADYQRKQIIKKFREKLYQIKNSDMDDLDLPKALALIQSEFLTDESNSQDDDNKDAKNDIQNKESPETIKNKVKINKINKSKSEGKV